MICMDAWTTIRFLHSNGKSLRWIARELGVSRNTVRSAIKEENIPEHTHNLYRESALEEYKEEIERMVFKDNLIGSRILKEITKKGFKGGKTAFYNYLTKIRDDKNVSRITERYETSQGEQTQFDWSEYTVMIGGELIKVYIFSTILSYSRKKYFYASLDMSQGSVFEALEEAFQYFRGVTKKVLVDNGRQMVNNANPERFEWNERFLTFAGYYRFEPKACRVRRPQTKGKVERPFYHLEQQFIKGNEFRDFEGFTKRLDEYREEVNNSVHSTTQQIPNILYKEENEKLTQLPEKRFVGTMEELRKASWDCLISVEGNQYSVPYMFAGKMIWIRKSQGRILKIYSQKGEEVARHELRKKKGEIIINEQHYDGLKQRRGQGQGLVKHEFEKIFGEKNAFLEGLIAQQKINPVKHLRIILVLLKYYSAEQIKKVMQRACELNCYSHSIIEGLLRREERIEMKVPVIINGKSCEMDVNVKRDLGEYDKILM